MKTVCIVLVLLSSFRMLMAQAQTDIQGHRGCRGLMPENTIEAFIKAIDLGVTTLEMDVVITKDNKVVLSHEPFLNHEICLGPNGQTLDTVNEKTFNIYQMEYSTLKLCDCGSKVHPRFKDQLKFKVYKPLLEAVIDTVEKYIASKKLKPVSYNIEIKSGKETDGFFHPVPSVYTDRVYDIIALKKISTRCILQSFDSRVLQYIHLKQYPVKTAFLIENANSFDINIQQLGFMPDIYSPSMELVDENLVSMCHTRHVLVIPWTANKKEDIKRLLKLKVDGIISDYPDRVVKTVRKNK